MIEHTNISAKALRMHSRSLNVINSIMMNQKAALIEAKYLQSNFQWYPNTRFFKLRVHSYFEETNTI